MSKVYNAAYSMGAVAAILSGAALAAAPTSFDAWTVTSGAIAPTGCPATFTCGTATTGDGFYQRQITDTATGKDYFQTIITDKGVSGSPGGLTFADENFVQSGNAGNGLADKSSINTSTTTGTLTEAFSATTALLTGWANNGGNDSAVITQGITANDTAAGAEDFSANFSLDQVGAEGAVSKLMRITGSVDLQETGGTTTASQNFVLVDRFGTANVTGGTVALGGTDGTINWADGQHVKAVFVSQDMSNVSGVGQEFGFTSYEKFTGGTSDAFVDTFSLAGGSAAAPVGWVTTAPPTGWGSFNP